ncbi:MAG TPA: Flp family type IVb pilin [Symbiobacteriaceae bacterium]|jgi:pilus assembly protein Flp/PilA|nr:Flp family type IVb pilin [Symbiobacteriaceae bacterium]
MMLRNLLKRREGQGMAEYGLILALVAVVAIAAVMLLGPKLHTVFTKIVNSL